MQHNQRWPLPKGFEVQFHGAKLSNLPPRKCQESSRILNFNDMKEVFFQPSLPLAPKKWNTPPSPLGFSFTQLNFVNFPNHNKLSNPSKIAAQKWIRNRCLIMC
jgi:hypothetical protein